MAKRVPSGGVSHYPCRSDESREEESEEYGRMDRFSGDAHDGERERAAAAADRGGVVRRNEYSNVLYVLVGWLAGGWALAFGPCVDEWRTINEQHAIRWCRTKRKGGEGTLHFF